jgi:hypothetical protein
MADFVADSERALHARRRGFGTPGRWCRAVVAGNLDRDGHLPISSFSFLPANSRSAVSSGIHFVLPFDLKTACV